MTKQLSLIGILLFIFQLSSYGQGSTYSGPYIPSSSIQWYGVSNQTISGLSFTNLDRTSIELWECANITIKNCKFSKSAYKAITAENAKNLTIENCVFDSVADGIFISSEVKNPFNNGTCSGIKIRNNYFRNIIGGWPGHHAVMFAGVNGGNGNQINYNSFESIKNQSHVDDIVSVFNSNGSVSDSIQVIGNWFRGGDYIAANHTGGAITVGDNGGSYIHVKGNILVNVVGGGIGNAGGNNIVFEENILLQEAYLANPSNWTWGLIMFNFDQDKFDCTSNTIRNNRVYYRSFSNENRNIDVSIEGACRPVSGLETNISDPTLSPAILPEDISGAKAAAPAPAPGITTESNSIQSEAGKYKIYPNPAVDNLTIETDAETDNAIIEFFDLKGQKVIEYPLIEKKTAININFLKVGIYIAKISSSNQQSEVRKIVVAGK